MAISEVTSQLYIDPKYLRFNPTISAYSDLSFLSPLCLVLLLTSHTESRATGHPLSCAAMIFLMHDLAADITTA